MHSFLLSALSLATLAAAIPLGETSALKPRADCPPDRIVYLPPSNKGETVTLKDGNGFRCTYDIKRQITFRDPDQNLMIASQVDLIMPNSGPWSAKDIESLKQLYWVHNVIYGKKTTGVMVLRGKWKPLHMLTGYNTFVTPPPDFRATCREYLQPVADAVRSYGLANDRKQLDPSFENYLFFELKNQQGEPIIKARPVKDEKWKGFDQNMGYLRSFLSEVGKQQKELCPIRPLK
ncbi:hypothetical protein FRC03_009251 [Tulasnella sp. 419]|nr:hypothetical protein FRC03_009251 [Tulasnella sp. 419]